MISYQFYCFLPEGYSFNEATIVRSRSPQEACRLYFAKFPRSRSRSRVALFVSDSLALNDIRFLKIIR